jgi:peroxiredoxin Q/BCP
MFGREGVLRKTFIIDPNGKVVKEFGRVTPLGHGQQIVETLKELTSS